MRTTALRVRPAVHPARGEQGVARDDVVGIAPRAICVDALEAFLRISTNARVYERPLSIAETDRDFARSRGRELSTLALLSGVALWGVFAAVAFAVAGEDP